MEAPTCDAMPERNWATTAAVATHATALAADPGAVRLEDFVSLRLPRDMRAIVWGSGGCPDIWLSSAFASPVDVHGDAAASYLRPVDALLLFQDGVVWCLTPREMDSLLGAAWERHASGAGTATGALLTHLCVAARAGGGLPSAWANGGGYARAEHTQARLPPSTLARLQLFAGDVTFGDAAAQRCVGALLASAAARGAALALPRLRGRGELVMLSQLETMCQAEGRAHQM